MRKWKAVAMTFNSISIIAAVEQGHIYYYNRTVWTDITADEPMLSGGMNWVSIDIDSTGDRVVAAVGNGNIYMWDRNTAITTATTGTWKNITPASGTAAGNHPWFGINISNDGYTIVAAESPGYIYTYEMGFSINPTWNVISEWGNWSGVSLSPSRAIIGAADKVGNAYIYDKPFQATSYTRRSIIPTSGIGAGGVNWQGISIREDATQAVIGSTTNTLYTWNEIRSEGWQMYRSLNVDEAGISDWRAVAMIPDGKTFTAAVPKGGVFVYYFSTRTLYDLTRPEGRAFSALEWTTIAVDDAAQNIVSSAYNGGVWLWAP